MKLCCYVYIGYVYVCIVMFLWVWWDQRKISSLPKRRN